MISTRERERELLGLEREMGQRSELHERGEVEKCEKDLLGQERDGPTEGTTWERNSNMRAKKKREPEWRRGRGEDWDELNPS